MREYEVTIIVQPQLEEEGRKELIARISSLLAPEATEETKPEEKHWGLRRLAYPIRKHTEGYYVLYEAAIERDPGHARAVSG
ncbi:MAG: 30S ribosomal protein S6, partial [Anaerolineae bacterium]